MAGRTVTFPSRDYRGKLSNPILYTELHLEEGRGGAVPHLYIHRGPGGYEIDRIRIEV